MGVAVRLVALVCVGFGVLAQKNGIGFISCGVCSGPSSFWLSYRHNARLMGFDFMFVGFLVTPFKHQAPFTKA